MSELANQPFSGEAFKQLLIEAKLMRSNEVSGCTDTEIEQAMKWQNVDFLPSTYREYLNAMGHYHHIFSEDRYIGKSPYFVGFDWDYKHLKWAKSDIEDMGIAALFPSDYFIFALELYGDGIYYFLTASKNNNPFIYYYRYNNSSPQKIADSFTDFLYKRYHHFVKNKISFASNQPDVSHT